MQEGGGLREERLRAAAVAMAGEADRAPPWLWILRYRPTVV